MKSKMVIRDFVKTFGLYKVVIQATILTLIMCSVAYAGDYKRMMPVTSEQVQANLDIVWICMAIALVFFMKAGFSMVEIGFTRGKNAVNAIMKNIMDLSVSAIVFWDYVVSRVETMKPQKTQD